MVDDDNVLDGAVDDINAIRMRTQEGFPNFGEVDDLMNFEQIQVGLQAEEDEWAYTHRGLGLPDRFSVDEAGTIKGPATDEVFLREYFKEYRRLMTTEPEYPDRPRNLTWPGMEHDPSLNPDPRRSSHYVSDDFYQRPDGRVSPAGSVRRQRRLPTSARRDELSAACWSAKRALLDAGSNDDWLGAVRPGVSVLGAGVR